MKKIVLLLLISFIAKPDYSAIGLELAKEGDADITAVYFDQVNSQFRVSTGVARAEAYGASATGQGLGFDLAFGNFNEGSFYAGVAYARAEAYGETVSDTGGYFGYAKLSGEGIDFDASINEDASFSLQVTRWFEEGLGLSANLSFPNEEDRDFENETGVGVAIYFKW